ncbi:ABC transporter ATP-binding protein [Phreatobacter oligotrophus]|uniref:ABC transporter ATP-binding protein n=1 Tax=Phreatobacter oligotrophus TaxID=1122261 RepID=UPI002355931A|nr:ABC transporter ATP-binding protein [Phreatobacter oligotrophus]MBX9991042.1 ABC transporter ATP-binding protein [Phreatobacter oligotrophus]
MSLALAKVAPPPDDGIAAQETGSTETGGATRVSAARPFIEFEKVTVRFGKGDKQVQALSETSLSIEEGDFVALVGPSGCGKSTLLKLVGDLLKPSTGHVFVGGRELGATPIRIGMAYQNPTLLPWMNIRDNVMLPLKIVPPFRSEFSAKRKTEFRDRVEALLAQVGLAGFGEKFPWQLSGGMMQRANLCRALIHEPDLLLLDEPFGALDQFTREELWQIMQDLWMTKKTTVLLVTHDLREAGFLANRICVMSARPGRILDDSSVAFARPRSIDMTYEADFVALNQRLRSLIVEARGGTGIVQAGGH